MSMLYDDKTIKRRAIAFVIGIFLGFGILLVIANIASAQSSFFDINDPIGVFRNYDALHSYEYFRISGGVEYFGGTVGSNCVALGDSFCNAVQFIQSANGDINDEYIFLELAGATSCSAEDFGNVDPLTPDQFLEECTAIATNIGYWPYGSEPQPGNIFGPNGLLGTSTTVLMASVIEGVQQTGQPLWPLFALVGVPLAFVIGLLVVQYIKRSMGQNSVNTEPTIVYPYVEDDKIDALAEFYSRDGGIDPELKKSILRRNEQKNF